MGLTPSFAIFIYIDLEQVLRLLKVSVSLSGKFLMSSNDSSYLLGVYYVSDTVLNIMSAFLI